MAAMLLPFAAIGTGAVVAARMQPETKRTEQLEDETDIQHAAIIAEYGMSASAWQAPYNKAVLMGSQLRDGVGLDVRDGGYPFHSDRDPLDTMRKDHVNLTKYDRLDTEYSLDNRRGEVRPRNKIAIASTLSGELETPWGASTEFGKTKAEYFRATPGIMPDGTRVLTVPTKLDVGSARVDTTAQVHGASVFRGNAPWQSFRYSEF